MINACQALYHTEQIREMERIAMEEEGISEQVLMDKAGAQSCHFLLRFWPDARYFTVIAGKGNNAGDGYTLAFYLHQRGRHVTVLQADPASKLQGVALKAYEQYVQAGGEVAPYTKDALDQADVLIDALLGIGIKGAVRPPFDGIIQALNACSRPVFALDGPSGLDADRGWPLGVAVQATQTVSMMAGKPGFYTGSGLAYCGEVVCADLELPERLFQSVVPRVYLMTQNAAVKALPVRPRHAHKGDFGRVLVVGGDYGMAGAVRLVCEAALRSGAGLVKAATRPDHLTVVSGQRPEIMCHGITRADDLAQLIQWSDVIALGPGLGQSQWSHALFQVVMASDKLKVIDADGLNLLAEQAHHRQGFKLEGQTILTPHPGEASRLLNCDTKAIQKDRYDSIQAIQKQYGGGVVLKGAGSLVSSGQAVRVINTGNPGMATAGMGDVLTGVLAAFWAQGFDLDAVLSCGVYCHGLAGDEAAGYNERGLMALDVVDALPSVVNQNHYRLKGAI